MQLLHLRAYLTELPKDAALLFVVDQQGRAINEITFGKDFHAALYAAGLAYLHFYGFRLTAAPHLPTGMRRDGDHDGARPEDPQQAAEIHWWQRAKERLSTSANTNLEDTRKRTERESDKLEWQTSAIWPTSASELFC